VRWATFFHVDLAVLILQTPSQAHWKKLIESMLYMLWIEAKGRAFQPRTIRDCVHLLGAKISPFRPLCWNTGFIAAGYRAGHRTCTKTPQDDLFAGTPQLYPRPSLEERGRAHARQGLAMSRTQSSKEAKEACADLTIAVLDRETHL